MNCTFDQEIQQHAVWSIILAGSESTSRFAISSMLLNRRGFFEQSSVSMNGNTTIHLIMNSTERNNGSVIQCVEPSQASILSATTIIVYGNLLL